MELPGYWEREYPILPPLPNNILNRSFHLLTILSMDNSENPITIINALRKLATDMLKQTDGVDWQVADTGGEGNFPFYFETSEGQFNAATYQWIIQNLASGGGPPYRFEDGNVFTNSYIEALGKVVYTLSASDQDRLKQGNSLVTDKQQDLMEAWVRYFHSVPQGDQQAFNLVIDQIVKNWAATNHELTVHELIQAQDVYSLLPNTPPAGQWVLPYLAAWIKAIQSLNDLENKVPKETHLLAQALEAVQSPTESNGALALSDGTWAPAFEVTTPLGQVIGGLEQLGNRIVIEATVSPLAEGVYGVLTQCTSTLPQQTANTQQGSLETDSLDFFRMEVDAQAEFFAHSIAGNYQEITIRVEYYGVTTMHYHPSTFSPETGKNWYYIAPIQEAASQTNAAASSFKFDPKPQIDFSRQGSFGYSTGVAICNYPSIQITAQGYSGTDVYNTLYHASNVGASWLETPIRVTNDANGYSMSCHTGMEDTLIIQFTPPQITNPSPSSRAWLLGVEVEYPVQ